MTVDRLRRRRQTVAAAGIAGGGLLGMSLLTEPDSPEFYALTLGVASVWTIGGLSSGPIPFRVQSERGRCGGRVVVPVVIGAGAFAAFYGCAIAARRIPVLNEAISSILQYADQGSNRLIMLTALANGAAEEVFFRGALYAAAGSQNAIAVSTVGYVLATTTTRNSALVLASAVMGSLFAWQRRASGGIQAPMLTHLTWSALMVRYLPPLFNRGLPRPSPAAEV